MANADIECEECSTPATHILVDYRHDIIDGGVFYCQKHAVQDGRRKCPCCDDYYIQFEQEEFLPIYGEGSLDNSGCCCEHP